MKGYYQIGDFCFSLTCPEGITPPKNFQVFSRKNVESEYDYALFVVDRLGEPEGRVIARREDILVCERSGLESRLLGVKGREGYYALYQETSEHSARIELDAEKLAGLHIDPVFTSLLALERRLLGRQGLVLHCAYTRYQGKAILFSAPSETGKTTQANLWQQHRGSETINGDKALLQRVNGVWTAQGWPVCGTSEVCRDEAAPIGCIVMLSQGKRDTVERLSPMKAFSRIYSQITVNRWNRQAVVSGVELLEALVGEVPVYHLSCTISEDAVRCLENAMEHSER